MNEAIASLANLLTEVVLPNLKSVQTSHAEQIAANDRLEEAIDELQIHFKSQFATISAQLTACRAEVAALQAALRAAQAQNAPIVTDRSTLVH